MKYTPAYATITAPREKGKHTFFFESVHPKNGKNLIKVVEFSSIDRTFAGKKVYNLGFGDYDPEMGDIEDDILSGNGDPYRVFNTVLNCVTIFFEANRKAALLIAGSDSSQEFVEKCRTACTRRCGEDCKKHHRRIKAYCNFICKNFSELDQRLTFLGGIILEDTTEISDFEPGKMYDIVLVVKKN